MKDKQLVGPVLPITLYIPHGSDESWGFFRGWKKVISLYIPHGSDESSLLAMSSSMQLTFISHMVQMKAERQYSVQQPPLPLYPTWFRWKTLPFKSTPSHQSTLYPTWFRWKVIAAATPKSARPTFISHMVQMKDQVIFIKMIYQKSFISHMVQMKVNTMYFLLRRKTLYIPHGSDESWQNPQNSFI